MISFIKNPNHKIEVMNLVKNARKEIKLCAPYIKEQVVRDILALKNKNIKIEVITSSNISSFINGGSDINAIKILLENKITVKNYQGLHAKIYISDFEKAIITSANLTYSGLNRNYEYGVLISEDNEALHNIKTDYKEMIKNENCGNFTMVNVLEIENIIKKIPKNVKIEFDADGDEIIYDSETSMDYLFENLSPWQQAVLEEICKLNKSVFSSKDTAKFIDVLKVKYPKNNNIDAKIRQVLQDLRDIGLIKFYGRGIYKKLWVTKE